MAVATSVSMRIDSSVTHSSVQSLFEAFPVLIRRLMKQLNPGPSSLLQSPIDIIDSSTATVNKVVYNSSLKPLSYSYPVVSDYKVEMNGVLPPPPGRIACDVVIVAVLNSQPRNRAHNGGKVQSTTPTTPPWDSTCPAWASFLPLR